MKRNKTIQETVKRTIPETEQIDVRAGKCTYGQMSDLGRVLDEAFARSESGEGNDVDTIKELIRTLHPDSAPAINKTNVKYAMEIAASVRLWRERESEKLKYTSSDEERAAGYETLAKLTGPTGVASTIAEKFGVHGGPDAVFKWPYATVFMVLYIDLERYKFQKRLQDIRDRKRRQKDKAARMGRHI